MGSTGHAPCLLAQYFHVALPRDVPSRADYNLHAVEAELLSRLTNAVKSVSEVALHDHLSRLDAVRLALDTCKALNVDGKVDKHILMKELRALDTHHTLIVYTTEQNAALLIYRQPDTNAATAPVVFEAFETSATCVEVLASKSSLQWDFPGRAVSVPYATFSDETFQENMAAFLEQASIESIKQFSAVTYKAAAALPEIRDTTRPAVITRLFMTLLEQNGARYDPKRLRKRVRDTVSFKEAHKPWRRSPFYLVLRVAVQRHLYRIFGSDVGYIYYKTILCFLVSGLLDDCRTQMPLEATHFLKQKLGRRLAKLEQDCAIAPASTRELYNRIFECIRPRFSVALTAIDRSFEQQWNYEKLQTRRPIRAIKQYADSADTELQLPASGLILKRIAFQQHPVTVATHWVPGDLLKHYESTTAKLKPFNSIAERHISLANFEEKNLGSIKGESRIQNLAQMIKAYILEMGNTLEDYPEIKSRTILNVMELWIVMDQEASKRFPLITKYHPGFSPEMLDVLDILPKEDMRRVQLIQKYLAYRVSGWSGKGSRTIFHKPAEDCFAVLYYASSGDSDRLASLHREIQTEATRAREKKKEEWEELSQKHEELMQQMAGLSCPYVTTVNPDGSTKREHQRGCLKHKYKWRAKQIKIRVFEYPLPKDESAAKAAVFELACPQEFTDYRDATWTILKTFGYSLVPGGEHSSLLHTYTELMKYSRNRAPMVCLASRTKSHLESHYEESGFPVALSDVCRPCGLKWEYYDRKDGLWTSRISHTYKASFAMNCPLKLPHDSPYRFVQLSHDIYPTSNQILASQTKCPTDLNVHEFMAGQSLLGGTHRRWLSLLREIGATNLNFSTDSTWAIVRKLIFQVGPTSSFEDLQDVHAVFEDVTFCQRLLGQIKFRLEAITGNWREPVQMDTMVSILLKTNSLSSNAGIQAIAYDLLSYACDITWNWSNTLRQAPNLDSKEISHFSIWASVLCKRTFQGFPHSKIQSTDFLQRWIVASVSLHDNLVGNFENLPHNLRNAVIQDIHSGHKIRRTLERGIMFNKSALILALDCIWPIPSEFLSAQPVLELLRNSFWVEMIITSKKQHAFHSIHFNIVRGDLLIDGKQSGSLPTEYRQPAVEMLFGTYNLRVLPSYLPGMSLFVARPMPYRHWIHLGFRQGEMIIRAVQNDATLELVSRSIFSRDGFFDIPSSLIENCYHWLNLSSGILEIRQDDMWKSKASNWKLDLRTRRMTKIAKRESALVDPNSLLAKRIFQNFHYFELATHIIVFQPQDRPLVVELKRLEISFSVNRNNRLESPQLGAEIPSGPAQDPGAWYGLYSKLVLRSVKNFRQRFILVPTGPIKHVRIGSHVRITIDNQGAYRRYDINEVLGRLECPAEPRLLYTLALCHAYTSHCLPDPLTKCTGLEQALFLLQSGAYKPWEPLDKESLDILLKIAELSPVRNFYPSDLRCMETTHWNPHLTTTMQDDRYRGLVEKIFCRSMQLSQFSTTRHSEDLPSCPTGNLHLELRSISRNSHATCHNDTVYISRDSRVIDRGTVNVAEIATILKEWPSEIRTTRKLASCLSKFTMIGGQDKPFGYIQIFDHLAANLGEEWGALSRLALDAGIRDRYRLLFTLGVIAFSEDVEMELLRVLVGFAILPALKQITPPQCPSYHQFKANEIPTVSKLADLMKDAQVPFVHTSSARSEPGQKAHLRLRHEKDAKENTIKLAESIRDQWPSVTLDEDKFADVDSALLRRDAALQPVRAEWARLTQNFEFWLYLDKVQGALHAYNSEQHNLKPIENHTLDRSSSIDVDRPEADVYPMRHRGAFPTLGDLLSRPFQKVELLSDINFPEGTVPNRRSCLADLPSDSTSASRRATTASPYKLTKSEQKSTRPEALDALSEIVAPLRFSPSSIHAKYGHELEQSIDAFAAHISRPQDSLPAFNPTLLVEQIEEALKVYQSCLFKISSGLEGNDKCAKWLQHAGLWPKITAITLLSEIRSTSGTQFGTGARETLVRLALQITQLQRLLRIHDASLKKKHQLLVDERRNIGHTNWSQFENVDWLLLEIDSNLMLREEQIEVAKATVSPASGQNSVLQLLMGKGKTSCILPMVAAVLADKHQLLRILVPRALLLQSAQVLQSKLGGLIDREILHIPFSRKTPTNRSLMQTFSQLHLDIKKNNGIMVALPEHILSFKLSGIQRLSDGKHDEASTMINFQTWLDKYTRDVLDECDVSLAIRTQLIYPSGSQITLDGHPLRWQTVQGILRLLRAYLPSLERRFPHSIEVVKRRSGDYPVIYFLRRDVEDCLIVELVRDISKGQLATLPCAELPVKSQEDIQMFISSPAVRSELVTRVAAIFKGKQHLMKVLYHLRGLFVHRILLSTLKKRWNVQYGLHPTRDPIAVPYQAKGVPSPTSEWGHPDVSIVLTCLSFYYQGLNLEQFRQAFEQLLKTDEPSIEYEKWSTKSLPSTLRDYKAINVEEGSQLRELHFYVRYNVYLLDFYLNNFVFPRHAKQFATKLQASGWDLVHFDPSQPVQCKTTGFSGTNDSRHQLPLTIHQNEELQKLAHTNAEVLVYLLEKRNRPYILAVDDHGKRLSEIELLNRMHNPYKRRGVPNRGEQIRVLIDAGAQILEHENQDLVKEWLKIDFEAFAAVYFDSDHRPWVLYKKGKTIPLVASPFADNLEGCLVYLDESHCRGTDLKIPATARAALTLGPHLTKDALAQAAMRLRLLGQSQSVTFVSPPEVHQSILDLRKSPEKAPLSSADVIAWLLEQSCNSIEQLEPLYYTQGNTYLQHMQAKLDNRSFLSLEHERRRYLSVMQAKELQTLEDLYGPRNLKRNVATNMSLFTPSLKGYVATLQQRKKQFQDRGVAVHSSALEEVEQEREVEFEVESVREVQHPVHFTPLKVSALHKDLKYFVSSGKLVTNSDAYSSMFQAIHQTELGSKSNAINLNLVGDLYVSTQFCKIVEVNKPNDNFVRPCQWIVWSSRSNKAIVVSPEEADGLLRLLRVSTTSITHLIVYAAPVTRRMLHFNDLKYHATPPLPSSVKFSASLKIELGIFAGRLYFDWHEYQDLTAFLGASATNSEEGTVIIKAKSFAKNPLTFLHEWLATLRKGQDFEHTPMGFITTGKPLTADHPFFLTTTDEFSEIASKVNTTAYARYIAEEESSDDESDDDEFDEEKHELARDQLIDQVDNEEFDEEDNQFFDTEEYIDEDQNRAEKEA